jgi:hypothetical protein
MMWVSPKISKGGLTLEVPPPMITSSFDNAREINSTLIGGKRP